MQNIEKLEDGLKAVLEFHKTMGLKTRKSPGFPESDEGRTDQGKIDLRLDLLDEEVKELEQASQKRNLPDVLDALCDIQYILWGAVLDYGLQDVFAEAFTEVQRSNMSKFCINTQEAKNSTDAYTFNKGVEAYYKKVGNNFVIYRSADDKVLKGLSYSEPKLKEIIKRYKERKQENV